MRSFLRMNHPIHDIHEALITTNTEWDVQNRNRGADVFGKRRGLEILRLIHGRSNDSFRCTCL